MNMKWPNRILLLAIAFNILAYFFFGKDLLNIIIAGGLWTQYMLHVFVPPLMEMMATNFNHQNAQLNNILQQQAVMGEAILRQQVRDNPEVMALIQRLVDPDMANPQQSAGGRRLSSR